MKLDLGDRVRDRLTPFKGIVVGRCEYLYGCVSVLVRPEALNKDATAPAEATWLDEDRLAVVKRGAIRWDPRESARLAAATGGDALPPVR